MKRYITIFLFFMTLSLYGQNSNSPFLRRHFEFGFGTSVGIANNLIGAGDIFKKDIEIDLNKLQDKISNSGFNLNFDVNADTFFKFRPQGPWGLELSTAVSGGIYSNMPKSILILIAEGNSNNHSSKGDITVFGGVFVDTKLNVHARPLKKLKIGITPALYVPVIYIPKSSINYNLSANDALHFTSSGEINVYSPISLNSANDEDSIAKALGFDVSLNAEYRLLSNLDVGADITHIPMVPSILSHQMNITIPEINISSEELIKGDSPNISSGIDQTYNNVSKRVFRPLRFDFYGLFRPLRLFPLTLRPNIGFTVLTPSEEPYFNAGLDLKLSLWDTIVFHIGTGYEELLWKHRLGLAVNMRFVELDIEAGLRSQDFDKSFQAQGFNFTVGMRFGW